jgi:hypothetical protein
MCLYYGVYYDRAAIVYALMRKAQTDLVGGGLQEGVEQVAVARMHLHACSSTTIEESTEHSETHVQAAHRRSRYRSMIQVS